MNFGTSLARSLYIHWPFCPYKCHFCPFVALAAHDQFMPAYHKALKQEIISFARSQSERLVLDTIFFGGGTPSTYPDDLLLDTFATLEQEFVFDRSTEVTIEVNPGTVRAEQLALWKRLGINRLSIGVQGLKDSVLQSLNRLQTIDHVHQALTLASPLFENISVDLIVGLPDVSAAEWEDVVRQVVTWPIKHVSVYFLTVHENTRLYFGVKADKVALPPDDAVVSMYEWTVDYLDAAGIKQYEISNFARPGYESRHNQVYWERKPYQAFGIGACSFDGRRRWQNEKNLMQYMQSIEKGDSTVVFEELLTEEQERLEKIMLGLRQKKGVTLQELVAAFPSDRHEHVMSTVAWLCEQKLAKVGSDRLTLTPRALAVENEIVLRLL